MQDAIHSPCINLKSEANRLIVTENVKFFIRNVRTLNVARSFSTLSRYSFVHYPASTPRQCETHPYRSFK